MAHMVYMAHVATPPHTSRQAPMLRGVARSSCNSLSVAMASNLEQAHKAKGVIRRGGGGRRGQGEASGAPCHHELAPGLVRRLDVEARCRKTGVKTPFASLKWLRGVTIQTAPEARQSV